MSWKRTEEHSTAQKKIKQNILLQILSHKFHTKYCRAGTDERRSIFLNFLYYSFESFSLFYRTCMLCTWFLNTKFRVSKTFIFLKNNFKVFPPRYFVAQIADVNLVINQYSLPENSDQLLFFFPLVVIQYCTKC